MLDVRRRVDEIREDQRSARAEVRVGVRLRDCVERREVVGDSQAARGGDLEERVAEVLRCWGSRCRRASCRTCRCRRAGRGCPSGSAAGPAPAIQNAPREPFGRDVEHRGLRERRRIVGHDPAGVGIDVAVRRPRDDQPAVHERQRRARFVLLRVEVIDASAAAGAGPGKVACDVTRAAEELAPRRHVERVQPLHVGADAVLRPSRRRRSRRSGRATDR